MTDLGGGAKAALQRLVQQLETNLKIAHEDLKVAQAQRDEFRAQLEHECAENERLRTALGEERLIEWLEGRAERLRGEAK